MCGVSKDMDDLLGSFRGYTKDGYLHIRRFGAPGSLLFGQEAERQIHHYRDYQCLISCT